MNVYRRYFKITSGKMVEEVQRVKKVNDHAKNEYKKFLKSIGAKSEFYIRDERMVGIIFKDEPDRYLFRKLHNGWWPKGNTKAGKELNKQLKAIKTVPENSCLRLVGLSKNPSLFGTGKCHYSTLVVIPSSPSTLLVSTPWYDEDPEEIAKYVADKKSGARGSLNIDTILWNPTPEMEEIKEWQYSKEISDWNESLKEQ